MSVVTENDSNGNRSGDQRVHVNVRRVAGTGGAERQSPPRQPRRGWTTVGPRWPMLRLAGAVFMGLALAVVGLASAIALGLLRAIWLGACRLAGQAVGAVARVFKPARTGR